MAAQDKVKMFAFWRGLAQVFGRGGVAFEEESGGVVYGASTLDL